jgi:hypothetical protein
VLGTAALLGAGAGVVVGGDHLWLHATAALVFPLLLLTATAWPSQMFCLAIVILAFWPVYAPPQYIIPDLVLPAGTVLMGFAAAGAVLRGGLRGIRLNAVDLAFGLLLLAMAMSVAAGTRRVGVFGGLVVQWSIPYLAARLIVCRYLELRQFAQVVAFTGMATIPFAVFERVSESNLFFHLAEPGRLANTWAVFDPRGSAFRVEGGLGHPLALGFVMALAALCALSLTVGAPTRRSRLCWLAAAAAMALTLYLADSRTGWVVLGVGAILLLIGARSAVISKARELGPRRLAVASGCVIAAAVLFFSLAPSSVTPGAGGGIGELLGTSQAKGETATYRLDLLEEAFEPGKLQILGNRVSKLSHTLASGATTLDNEYLLLADEWGLLALAAMLALAASLAVAWLRMRGLSGRLAGAALSGAFGVFFVALITQQAQFFWLFVGVAGAAAQASLAPNARG